uniref:MIR domain-containing protein n=1 Tax=Cynoglossus semilaevis TaxID=244447 RepID=A0A3P8VTZ3_CYNSE
DAGRLRRIAVDFLRGQDLFLFLLFLSIQAKHTLSLQNNIRTEQRQNNNTVTIQNKNCVKVKLRAAWVSVSNVIRMYHKKTFQAFLFFSLISLLHQEVSAFGENGEGDDLDVWAVQCDGDHWEWDEVVRFKHVGTNVFLSVTEEQYGHPIRGQQEVYGMSSPSSCRRHPPWWCAMEGVFIQPSQELLRHDEL